MGDGGLKDGHQDSHQGSAYRRIELITGEARRRRWSAGEKAAILADSFRPGVCVAEVARRYGVSRSLLCNWRRQARGQPAEAERTFVPIRIVEAAGVAEPAVAAIERRDVVRPARGGPRRSGAVRSAGGTIDIEMGGMRVRVSGTVDAAALRQVLAELGRRA